MMYEIMCYIHLAIKKKLQSEINKKKININYPQEKKY